MVSFNPLNIFKSNKTSESTEAQNQNPTFDPNTLQMVQPGRTEAPSMGANGVVNEQPARQEQMQMQLRGGGEAGFCCGLCAGIACFECCEICC
ncbi:hypothetical protein BJX63DRAFT_428848 [Aspergillus granulosus]|uniref:Cysteine-rich transmembrane CYSTM domain-containing protein n=1 Tax=Aspergillus granulosus TaxID=176169 RepID=A0ABR4HV05_9EURO